MLKYFILFTIILLIYSYDKPIILKNHNSYIKFHIEKNILIIFVSIIGGLILFDTTNFNNNHELLYIIFLILINFLLWIRVIKLQYLNDKTVLINEKFTADIKKYYSTDNKVEKSVKDFDNLFYTQCYDKIKILDNKTFKVDEEQIKDFQESKAIDKQNTIDLALNSDDLFVKTGEENKCIIANYIPDNLELINNNYFENI